MAIIDKPSDYFETVTYTGNTSSGTTINSLDFAPNMVWFKSRTNAENHQIYDSVRGVTKRIIPNGTQAEATASTGLTNFDSNGFRTGGENETDSGNIVAWNWKAGGTAVSNTNGSITSSVSANQDAGFSIVKYTSTGTTNSTIGHGLNATPTNVIIKCTSDAATSWISKMKGADGYVYLDQTYALTSNSTWLPTSSSTITLTNTWGAYNTSGRTYIAYCFSEVKSFSKFGSYTGNGSSDGTFVYTGGKPSWLMVKRTDSVQGWYILDNKRNTFNPEDKYLEANDSDAEATFTFCDFLSNGFKARVDNTGTGFNASGGSYIYMCFNENPFTTSTGVPATAR